MTDEATAPDPTEHPRRRDRARRVGKGLLEEWGHDRVPDLAAEVAFYAILSLFPAVLAMASLLGVLDSIVGGDVALEARTEVLDYLRSILTSEADATLEAADELFANSRPGLLTFSLLAALWALSRGFAALVRALDIVYDLDEKRGWFNIRLTALALAVGSILAGAVMLAMFVVGPLFGSGEQIADEIGLGDQFVFLWDVVRIPAAFVVLLLWAATIFHVAPDHRTPWRWDVPGAIVTGVLWVLFSVGLNVYLDVAESGNAVFGALGGALIVLLWFWVLALAVLIGGEVNEILYREFVAGEDGPEPEAEGRSAFVDGASERPDELAGVER